MEPRASIVMRATTARGGVKEEEPHRNEVGGEEKIRQRERD